jgi:uncharacterized caspase-like protein
MVLLMPRDVRAGGIVGVRSDRDPGKLRILSIGINQYHSPIYNPLYGKADALAVRDAFVQAGHTPAFTGVETESSLLLDATLAQAKNALVDLAKNSNPNDVLVFYFAGMGKRGKGSGGLAQYSFLFSDSTVKEGDVDAGATVHAMSSFELSQLLLAIPARRQIVILDSLQSSDALEAVFQALNQDTRLTLDERGRRFALLGLEGFSNESRDLGHGLMTYALLQGLAGEADANHDGVINLAELEGYLIWKIPDLARRTAGMAGNEQLVSHSTLRDLAVTVLDPKKAAALRGLHDESATATAGQQSNVPNYGKDYALIFANEEYEDQEDWHPLHNPVFDGKTLRDELEQNYGYSGHIELKTNATQEEIVRSLREWSDPNKHQFEPNDRLLIFFAGHGHYDGGLGLGYFVARDSKPLARDHSLASYLNLSTLRDIVDHMPARHILIVIDACYAGSFDHRIAMGTKRSKEDSDRPTRNQLIERKLANPTRLYLVSAGIRSADDGPPGQHSPFARALLNVLRSYGGDHLLIDMQMLESEMDAKLKEQPKYGPFDRDTESGDFIFIPTDHPHPVKDPSLEK